ncbi:hypothetical protein [Listeria sp. ILCC797]|uniref:hypothetical protein n=1 Tax=Listeria sp. ILCC797 TaxID=1918333 RepID=UPI000B58BE90|nr:hypothetical protein [Listeria sp. ILCC797]
MTTLQDMKKEALRRMEKIGLHTPLCANDAGEDMLFYSDGYSIQPIEKNEEIKRKVQAFQEENPDKQIYFILLTESNLGTLLNYLFVTDNEEEWTYDESDLNEGYAFCYVENLTFPDCSEYGTIGIQKIDSGIKRIS